MNGNQLKCFLGGKIRFCGATYLCAEKVILFPCYFIEAKHNWLLFLLSLALSFSLSSLLALLHTNRPGFQLSREPTLSPPCKMGIVQSGRCSSNRVCGGRGKGDNPLSCYNKCRIPLPQLLHLLPMLAALLLVLAALLLVGSVVVVESVTAAVVVPAIITGHRTVLFRSQMGTYPPFPGSQRGYIRSRPEELHFQLRRSGNHQPDHWTLVQRLPADHRPALRGAASNRFQNWRSGTHCSGG